MHLYLLSPPFVRSSMNISPPVGLAYLASVVQSLGHKVSVLTSDLYGLSCEDTIERIVEASPDVLGVTVTTPCFNNSVKIINGVKERLSDIVTISGGAHATIFPEEMLKSGFDIVVRGEGEKTIIELMDYFNKGKAIEEIDGISYRKGSQICHNNGRELIKDLNDISFPAWKYFPIRDYKTLLKKSGFSLPIVSSRGCPGKCTFCYKGVFGSRFRMRTPESIVEEVVFLKKEFGIEEFSIIDDCFTVIAKRAIKFCKLLKESGVNIPWSLPSGIRVDTVSEELLRNLKEARCYRVSMGIETGNQEIMDNIKKGITLDQVRNARKLIKNAGIECSGNFIIGNIEEDLDTINDTINFAIELDPDYAQFTRAMPYPGSEMYSVLKEEGRILSEDWDDYDYFLSDKNIFDHKNLRLEQIQQKMHQANRRFYLRPKFIIRELRKRISEDGVGKLLKMAPIAFNRFFR